MIFKGYPGGTQVEMTDPGEGNTLLPGLLKTDPQSLKADPQSLNSWYQTGKLLMVIEIIEKTWNLQLSTCDWNDWEQWLEQYASQPGGPWQAGAGG